MAHIVMSSCHVDVLCYCCAAVYQLHRLLMGTPAGSCKDRIFLCRNTGRSRDTTADQDGHLLDVFAQVAINNGLECKVACSNSKVGTRK